MNGKLYSWAFFSSQIVLLLTFFLIATGNYSSWALILTAYCFSLGLILYFLFTIHSNYTPAGKSKKLISMLTHIVTAGIVVYMFLDLQPFYALSCMVAYFLVRITLLVYGNATRVTLIQGKGILFSLKLVAITLLVFMLYKLGNIFEGPHPNIKYPALDQFTSNIGYHFGWGMAQVMIFQSIGLAILAELGIESNQEEPKVVLPEASNIDEVLPLFHWRQPRNVWDVLSLMDPKDDLYQVHQIDQIRQQFPLSNFKLTTEQQKNIRILEDKISAVRREILQHNINRPHKLYNGWCPACRQRPEPNRIADFNVDVCPKCHHYKHLVGGVKTAIGIIGETAQKPDPDGQLLVNTWDQNTHTFIAGQYERLRITQPENLDIDWYISAMVEWATETRKTRKNPIAIEALDLGNLSPNSLRIIQAAEKKQLITLAA